MLERFMISTERPADPRQCWTWIGRGRDHYGYPRLKDPATGDWVQARRFALAHFAGVALVPGRRVRATCDNPDCVRPEHAYQEGPDRPGPDQPELSL